MTIETVDGIVIQMTGDEWPTRLIVSTTRDDADFYPYAPMSLRGNVDFAIRWSNPTMVVRLPSGEEERVG